jgi:NAD(P)-dependent dehydrogenase (short-subunit alcohol dehydrogenase family)
MLRRAVSAFGGVDAIYANAGISGGLVPLMEQTVDMWQEILRVNLIGPFLAIQNVAPLMVKQGKGSIVCTASVAGSSRERGRTSLQREQGWRDQPRADGRELAVGHLASVSTRSARV